MRGSARVSCPWLTSWVSVAALLPRRDGRRGRAWPRRRRARSAGVAGCWMGRAFERLDVLDERHQLLLADQALERRHDRLEAGRPPWRWATGSTRGCRPRRPSPPARRSSSHACCRRAPRGSARGPGASDRWQVMHARSWNSFWPWEASEPSDAPPESHAWYSVGSITTIVPIIPECLRAAVLGAEQVVAARLGRVEPERRVAAGDDVGLQAERGDEERVNDVLGGRRSGAPRGRPARAAR